MATGISHRHNALKLRILHAAYHLQVFEGKKFVTSSMIADFTGADIKNVSRALSTYYLKGYGYFRRLGEAKAGQENRYTLNKKGINTYKKYAQRAKCGLEMNFARANPRKVRDCSLKLLSFNKEEDYELTVEELAPYIKINFDGEQSGITEDKKLKLAGISNNPVYDDSAE